MPPNNAEQNGSKHWALDKRIPLGLILTMTVQTIAVGIWLGTVQARLNYVEGYIDNRQEDISRLAVVETRLTNLQHTLQEMKQDIKFLRDRVQ